MSVTYLLARQDLKLTAKQIKTLKTLRQKNQQKMQAARQRWMTARAQLHQAMASSAKVEVITNKRQAVWQARKKMFQLRQNCRKAKLALLTKAQKKKLAFCPRWRAAPAR